MNIDGSASSLPDRPYDIAWSFDGQQVAFSKFSDNGNSQLYVAAVWNGQIARATLIAGGPGQETLNPHSPAWSADGGRVAFLGDWKNSSQLFTISRDGSSLLQFSRDSTISCAHPSWSPDGRWIVAGCGQKEGSAEPFGDLYQFLGADDVYLFDAIKIHKTPKKLTSCGSDSSPSCRAQHPSFAPVL